MSRGINLLIGADVKQAVSELQRLNGFVNNWSSQVRGAMISAFSFYAVYQGFRNTIQSINEFNKSISELKALTGLAGSELEKLRQNALNLAGAYRAIDIAKGQSELSRLGFSPEEINKSIKAITLLATATGTDLPKATEIAGSTLRSFGLEASQMQRVTDVMASSFNKTALDVTSFGEAMKYVAPNAAAANISLEETTAMLGTLANNGIKGSMAGTALRRIVQDLAGESGTLADKFQKLNEKNITASYAFDEVGRIASTAFLILARGAKTTDELTEAFHNVNGETQKMADIMMDNVIGAWKLLNAEWDRVINDNSGPLTSFMTELLQNMKDQLAVWNSPHVTFWQKLFGDRDDYAVYAKNIATMREEMTKLNAATFDMSDEGMDMKIKTGGAGGGGSFRDALKGGAFGGGTTEELKKIRSDMFGGAWVDRQVDSMKDLNEELAEFRRRALEAAEASQTFKDITFELEKSEKLGDNIFSDAGEGKGGKDDKGESAAKKRGVRIGQALVNGFNAAIKGIADALVVAFSGGNWWAALLDTLGNVAIELGTLIIGIGIGLQSIKKALENWAGENPALAIAAGVALVGLGVAMKTGAASIASGGGGGGSNVQSSMPRFADKDASMNGEWRIRGADLVYVLDKQGYRSSIVGG
jgi:hypothetical protein